MRTYTGTADNPLQLDPFQQVVEFNWGSNIGVLIIDFPDGITFNFDPFFASSTSHKTVGDIIEKKDFAKFTDGNGQHPAPISLLITDKIILSTLYGDGDDKWFANEIWRQPGPDPGSHNNPSAFPPNPLLPNSFPNSDWSAYVTLYNSRRDFWNAKENSRWIEIDDVSTIGADTLTSGIAQTYFGPGETWQDFHYGTNVYHHYELAPYDPPRYTFVGAQQYNTLFITDPPVPGSKAVQWFDLFTERAVVGWGFGETISKGSPGRKAVRQIYFFDFDVIKEETIVLSMNSNRTDPQLPSYSVKFRFQIFPQATKFTLTANSITGNPLSSYDKQKAFPYTTAGTLFRLNSKGFVE